MPDGERPVDIKQALEEATKSVDFGAGRTTTKWSRLSNTPASGPRGLKGGGRRTWGFQSLWTGVKATDHLSQNTEHRPVDGLSLCCSCDLPTWWPSEAPMPPLFAWPLEPTSRLLRTE